MKAISVGLESEALVIRPQDKTIFNYLQYVDNKSSLALDLKVRDVENYENCALYRGNQFLAYVSMSDLEAMIPAVNRKMAYLVDVKCDVEQFMYSIDEAFFEEACIGTYRSEFEEISPIIKSGRTLWTISEGVVTKVDTAAADQFTVLTHRESQLYYNHLKSVMRQLNAHAFTFGTDSIYFENKEGTIQVDRNVNNILNSWRRQA